jgi:hypothetical protein
MSEKADREADLDRVLAVADQVSGGRRESLLWLRHPLKEFKGKTAESLVAMGRADDVIGYLNSTSNGFVG